MRSVITGYLVAAGRAEIFLDAVNNSRFDAARPPMPVLAVKILHAIRAIFSISTRFQFLVHA